MSSSEIYARLLAELEAGWEGLPDKPDETPQSTLSALWFFAGGESASSPLPTPSTLPELSSQALERLETLVRQRKDRAPLSYLLGRHRFMDLDLLAAPGAMIPRVETEILARAALEALAERSGQRERIRALDLCTGSGNIALFLAAREPRCAVVGADISPEAVALAQENARHLHLEKQARFVVSDLFAAFETPEYLGKLDLITCNPPYISSAQVNRLPAEIQGYEPRLAFDGGPFGVQVLARLIREAPRFAAPGSCLCFEVGLGQGQAIANMVRKSGKYAEPELFRDPAGEIRALKVNFAD